MTLTRAQVRTNVYSHDMASVSDALPRQVTVHHQYLTYNLFSASEYEIRYSEDPDVLRSNFSNAHLINSSNLLPSESGSSEQLSFTPTHGTMRNGTTLFFAVKAVDNDMLSSETSNLAQVTNVIGYVENGVNINAIVISVTILTIVVGLIACVTVTKLKLQQKAGW